MTVQMEIMVVISRIADLKVIMADIIMTVRMEIMIVLLLIIMVDIIKMEDLKEIVIIVKMEDLRAIVIIIKMEDLREIVIIVKMEDLRAIVIIVRMEDLRAIVIIVRMEDLRVIIAITRMEDLRVIILIPRVEEFQEIDHMDRDRVKETRIDQLETEDRQETDRIIAVMIMRAEEIFKIIGVITRVATLIKVITAFQTIMIVVREEVMDRIIDSRRAPVLNHFLKSQLLLRLINREKNRED